jgi:integrase
MPAPVRRKLSRSALAALAPGDVLRDSEVIGLQARRNPGGSLVFRVEVSLGDRKRKVAALDLRGLESHDLAAIRQLARSEIASLVKHGRTLAEQAQHEQAERDASRPITVAELWERHSETHFRSRSAKYRRDSESHFARFIAPAFGRREVPSLKRSEVANWHAKLISDHGLAQGADRVLSTFRAMLSTAVRYDIAPANVATRVRQVGPGDPVRRPLSTDEIARLWRALDDYQGRADAADLVRFLLLSGCRVSEPLNARWSGVDTSARSLTLRVHKTARRSGVRTIALHREALAALERHRSPAEDAPLFGFRYTAARRVWLEVCDLANLGTRRIHDLRHTWREWASRTGIPADVAEAAIGHALPGIVGVYSAPPLPALLDAADRVGDALLALRSASGSASTSAAMKRSKSSTR